jgi:Transposase DDE domain.
VFKRAANQRPVQEVSTARALNQLEPQKFAVSTQEKKINGVKQHIMVDTLGLLLLVVVHSAAIQDRDGAKLVMERAKGRFPRLKLIWADGGYILPTLTNSRFFGLNNSRDEGDLSP